MLGQDKFKRNAVYVWGLVRRVQVDTNLDNVLRATGLHETHKKECLDTQRLHVATVHAISKPLNSIGPLCASVLLDSEAFLRSFPICQNG